MSANMSTEEKLALVIKHASCEVAADWEGALSTLTDDCFYEYYPRGIRMNTFEAIQEQWTRIFSLPVMQTRALKAAKNKLWIYEDSAMILVEWPVLCPDGETRMTSSWGIYTFRGKLISSEIVLADTVLDPFMDQAFDETFMKTPGVERLKPQNFTAGPVMAAFP